MISFVIPCYIATEELKQLTIRTIESMRCTSNVYIVCVDDGSPLDTGFMDGLADKTIHLEKNSGFAVASNTGLQYCIDNNFEYIGVANNDIEVFEGWIQELVYPFTAYEDVGVTGLISSKERMLEGKPIAEYKVPKRTQGGLLYTEYPSTNFMQSGGLLLSTRDVWLKVGLYDTDYLIGGEEDVALFHTMIMNGYKIVMSGYSCFWHKEGATRWNDEVEAGYKEKNKAIEQTNYDKFKEKWGWDIRTDGLRFTEDILE